MGRPRFAPAGFGGNSPPPSSRFLYSSGRRLHCLRLRRGGDAGRAVRRCFSSGRYLSTPSEQARGMSLSSLAAVDRAAVVVHSARRLTTRSSPGPSACSSCHVAVQFSLPLKPTRS
ncbi:hypothetical protein SASPL_150421 [Salvia splendens]|uniref:Uncharacterized protein n=1 Tax=Salvia splendens TaxID=180675 RepID=A0A8X8W6U5_SALSN|nr:hypothetical protein SASPL_150421 [Salvia splendens]